MAIAPDDLRVADVEHEIATVVDEIAHRVAAMTATSIADALDEAGMPEAANIARFYARHVGMREAK